MAVAVAVAVEPLFLTPRSSPSSALAPGSQSHLSVHHHGWTDSTVRTAPPPSPPPSPPLHRRHGPHLRAGAPSRRSPAAWPRCDRNRTHAASIACSRANRLNSSLWIAPPEPGMSDPNPFDARESPVGPSTAPAPLRPAPCALPPLATRDVPRPAHAYPPRRPVGDTSHPRVLVDRGSAVRGSQSSSTTTSSGSPIDLEKAGLAHGHDPSSPGSRNMKQHGHRHGRTDHARHHDAASPYAAGRPPMRERTAHDPPPSSPHWDEEADDFETEPSASGREQQEANAVKILLFLSGPCALLALMNLCWALIALVITLLTQPVRICARRPSVAQQLAGLLGPSLNLHLRSIYTPLPPHADEDASYHSGMLLLVHLLSPFVALAAMHVAWLLAVYWVSSAIIGDPAGQDKRDDGRECVLGLRGWWERWLMRSIKEV